MIDVSGGSAGRLQQRAQRMVRDALASYLGVEGLRACRYATKLAVPAGEREPLLYVTVWHEPTEQSRAAAINLRQVFAGSALRDLVDAAVRSALEQMGLLGGQAR